MPEYLIRWEINITADSPQEAAEAAQEIQRDPNSLATVFHAYEDNDETLAPVVIDLVAVGDDGTNDPYFNDPFAKPGH